MMKQTDESENDAGDLARAAEGLRLHRAFLRISDPEARKSLVVLAEKIGQSMSDRALEPRKA